MNQPNSTALLTRMWAIAEGREMEEQNESDAAMLRGAIDIALEIGFKLQEKVEAYRYVSRQLVEWFENPERERKDLRMIYDAAKTALISDREIKKEET